MAAIGSVSISKRHEERIEIPVGDGGLKNKGDR